MAIRWSHAKRERFADLHERKCAHCGKTGLVSKLRANGDEFITYNIDHIIPEVAGGTDDESNLRLLCRPCNSSKNGMSHEDFPAHHERKQEVAVLKRQTEEATGLSTEYVDKIASRFSIKDQHHVFTHLVEAFKIKSSAQD